MSDLLPCPFCGGESYLKGFSTNCFCMCMDCGAQSDDGSAERVTAAWNIRALPAVQPRVKPLVWTAFSKECLRAESIFGIYELMWGFQNGQAFLSSPHLCRIDTWHPDIEFAKAYAATDYEARIMSALEPAVQPDAAAIREAALRDAISHARQALVDAAHNYRGTSRSSAMFTAEDHVTVALSRLIDTGKEVMPLDAGTTETQTQAHDIGPGDQAVAGAAPWPEGLIHLTNTRRFHVDCATEGCGRRVSTRFEGSDYCETCGRKVALAQKGGE